VVAGSNIILVDTESQFGDVLEIVQKGQSIARLVNTSFSTAIMRKLVICKSQHCPWNWEHAVGRS
jgi:hypothetical protein